MHWLIMVELVVEVQVLEVQELEDLVMVDQLAAELVD